MSIVSRNSDVQISEAELADRSMKISAHVAEALYPPGRIDLDVELARQLGQNIIKEELGAHSRPLEAVEPYDLTDIKPDSLLAHTRQDVAMNFSMLRSSLERTGRLENNVRGLRNIALSQVSLILILLILAFW